MRVLVTVLALVTAPFLASVSQEPADNDAVRHSDARTGDVEGQDNNDGDQQCENAEHPEARQSSSRGMAITGPRAREARAARSRRRRW